MEKKRIEKEEIRVSVIVPCYNREKTIKRCIDSIEQQTVAPFEVIVVDDGSTDGTIDILERMQYGNLGIIKQNHRGAQAARNLGIINAKGNYIAFLDSDDEWLPQMLEVEIAQLLRGQENCVIYSDCFACNDKKRRPWRLPDCGGDSYAELLMHPGPMFQSILAKKDLFLKMGLLDEKVVAWQEWDTSIRLAQNAKFIHIRRPLFIYNFHNGETVSKDRNKDIQGYAYIVKKFQNEIIRIHGAKVLNSHYAFLIKRCFRHRNGQMIVWMFRMFCLNIGRFF